MILRDDFGSFHSVVSNLSKAVLALPDSGVVVIENLITTLLSVSWARLTIEFLRGLRC